MHMSQQKIYIYGRLGLHKAGMKMLDDYGCTVVRGTGDTEEQFLTNAGDAQVIIMDDNYFKSEWFDQLPNLKLIIRRGVGYDKIPLSVATEHNVLVANTPGTNEVSVAEVALGLMMETVRHIPQAREQLYKFDGKMYPLELLSHTLSSSTVGLVGYGNIAKAAEKMLTGFGSRILVTAHHQHQPKYGEYVDLETLLRKSDIVSLHLPATPSTTGMFNKDLFSKMKDSAIIVNTSRGALINEPDLVEAIENGQLGGAGLDTTAQEPVPKNSILLGHDQIVLLPHIGGFTIEAEIKTAKMVAQNAIDLFNGVQLKYAVN